MRISDWSSDVCSSDVNPGRPAPAAIVGQHLVAEEERENAGQRLADLHDRHDLACIDEGGLEALEVALPDDRRAENSHTLRVERVEPPQIGIDLLGDRKSTRLKSSH